MSIFDTHKNGISSKVDRRIDIYTEIITKIWVSYISNSSRSATTSSHSIQLESIRFSSYFILEYSRSQTDFRFHIKYKVTDTYSQYIQHNEYDDVPIGSAQCASHIRTQS